MKTKLKFLFCLVTTLAGFMLLSQTAVAYTYPDSSKSSSGAASAVIIPLVLLAIGFVAVAIVRSRRANRVSQPDKSGNSAITQGSTKVSKVVEEKLLPGEKVITEISAGRSDFVATDKRLLRFSAGGCEALEYAKISEVSYKVPQGKRLAGRITLGLCAVILLMIAVGIWVGGALDPSVRNVSISDATIVSLVCIGIAGFSLWGIKSLDFGYYQIESQTSDKTTIKGWRLPRPLFARARVDGFVKAVKERIASSAKPA
jgi:hypothetical protein